MASSAPDDLTPAPGRCRSSAIDSRAVGSDALDEGDRRGRDPRSSSTRRRRQGDAPVALIAEAFAETAVVFDGAAAGSNDPLAAIAAAYRGWALAHPHLYRLMMDRPLPRERLPVGLEDTPPRPRRGDRGDPDAARPRSRLPTAWSCSSQRPLPPGADLDAAWAGVNAVRSPKPVVKRRAARPQPRP
jgi:hypothetical protein